MGTSGRSHTSHSHAEKGHAALPRQLCRSATTRSRAGPRLADLGAPASWREAPSLAHGPAALAYHGRRQEIPKGSGRRTARRRELRLLRHPVHGLVGDIRRKPAPWNPGGRRRRRTSGESSSLPGHRVGGGVAA